MISSLLLQLAKGIWFIEPIHAEAYKPAVAALLRGDSNFKELFPKNQVGDDGNWLERPNFSYAIFPSENGFTKYESFNDAPRGSIAVTCVTGVVMKTDYCGSPGTKRLNSWMLEGDKHANIIGHILLIDSPGGSADGTLDFSESIKSMNKPVVAFSDGLMCSAAYWIGSSARHIMASNVLNEIGSIGTYMTLLDDSGWLEQNGLKEISVYASKSTEKNIEFKEALKGNTKLLLDKIVNPFNDAFMKSVVKNRFGKSLDKENTLKGQLHLTHEALEFGLIDSVGSFSDAIALVQKFSKKA